MASEGKLLHIEKLKNRQLCSLVNRSLFRISHARAEGGGGREGKNGLAKLARFLKGSC